MRLPSILVATVISIFAISPLAQAQTAHLTVDIKPSGPFMQMDVAGDSYTLTVTNAGSGDTKGPVILIDSLPAGLTPLSISTTGWTCNLTPVQCTERDFLKPGDSYPPIVLSVSVSATTETKVTNAVIVAGGGETDAAPATAKYVTDIQPIQPAPRPPDADIADQQCTNVRVDANKNGYDVLYYDARTGKTEWEKLSRKDPAHPEKDPTLSATTPTLALAPFLPKAHTKDQIMVVVCGLKFDTQVNISMSSIAIPEAGADIRGSTPTQTTASVPPGTTSDALQAVAAASNTAIAALLQPNSTVVSLAPNGIITPGAIKSGAFAGASIQATPEDFFRALQGYEKEAKSTLRTIQSICLNSETECQAVSDELVPLNDGTFGTAWDVNARAIKLYQEIRQLAGAANSSSNTGTFDTAKAKAQQFSVVLAALDSQITAASLGARAANLAATYRALAGNLAAIRDLKAADLKGVNAGLPPGAPLPDCAYMLSLPAAGAAGAPGAKGAPGVGGAGGAGGASAPTEQQLIHADYCYLDDFQNQLTSLGVTLTKDGPGEDITGVDVTPKVLYKSLTTLRSNLQTINNLTDQSFAEINDWYGRSSVIYTDNLTPSTTNLGIRIGINATEMFVPFTLSFAPGTTATTATATPGHFESSTELLIQRRVYLNLVGGVIGIRVPTKTFALNSSTVTTPGMNSAFSPCGGTSTITTPATVNAPTYYCGTTTGSSHWQVAGIVAIDWLPFGRNYYPKPRSFRKCDTWTSMFGLMLGSSVTSLGTVFGGLNLEPTNGLGVYAGVASAHSETFPSGGGSGSNIYTSSTVSPVTALHWGFAFGVGFDFSVFTQIFKGGASPTAP